MNYEETSNRSPAAGTAHQSPDIQDIKTRLMEFEFLFFLPQDQEKNSIDY
jgi:hypothetical protein